jgi:hypothetical protein
LAYKLLFKLFNKMPSNQSLQGTSRRSALELKRSTASTQRGRI